MVVAVLAAVVIVLALGFYLVTLVWAGRNRMVSTTVAGGSGRSGPASGRTPEDDSSGSLARGFSYLHVSPRSASRRPGVQQRLQSAFARIDAVDPHAAPRRIGEALMQPGLVEPDPLPTRRADR